MQSLNVWIEDNQTSEEPTKDIQDGVVYTIISQ